MENGPRHTARDLPSLNALRAFESAARHLSFTRAARELCVTQGAVSRQVKQLEDQLKVPLFHRLHRRLILTDQGRMLKGPLENAFDIMAATLDRLKNEPTDLKLKVHPTFAIRWLIPRLHRFQSLFPEIQVRLTTSSVNVDFSHENFDVGITYSGTPVKGVNRRTLFTERLTPVCSPGLLTPKRPLTRPQDLRHHLLLHNNPEQREWPTWADAVGVSELGFERGQIFEVDDAALQAAASGLGVALGDLSLIREDLESGRLIRPLPGHVVETGVYYVSWPGVNNASPALGRFIDWILEEAKAAGKTEQTNNR